MTYTIQQAAELYQAGKIVIENDENIEKLRKVVGVDDLLGNYTFYWRHWIDSIWEIDYDHIPPKGYEIVKLSDIGEGESKTESVSFEIDYGGNVLAGIRFENGEPIIIGAMDGWGNGITSDRIKITKLTT